MKLIYNNVTASVKLDNCKDEYRIKQGIREGDVVSHQLFIATLEELDGSKNRKKHISWCFK